MQPYQVYRYIVLDGNKYVVATGSYVRSWTRSFSSQLAANIVRLNFVDRGPGVRVYSMTLIITSWPTNSQPYKDGVTASFTQQIQNLEASYAQAATSLEYIDPLGQTPSTVDNPDGGEF